MNTARLAPGILPSREAAAAALLRIFSRARRHRWPLGLYRLECGAAEPAPLRRFLHALAADLRVQDLAWWEGERRLMLLLEAEVPGEAAAASPGEAAARWRRLAAAENLPLRLAGARFPQHGITFAALLESLREVEP